MQIRLLSDHRNDLVAERTRMQNRLRWHLVALAPELEASQRPHNRWSAGRVDRRRVDLAAAAVAP